MFVSNREAFQQRLHFIQSPRIANMVKFDRKAIHQLISIETCFTLFCVSLFLYQAVSLFNEYNKGKTVVRIELGHLFDDGPPGITVCPAGLNMKKMATIDERYKKMYKDYINMQSNFSEHENLIFNANYFNMVSQDIIEGNISLGKIIKNYTYDYKEEIKKNKLRFDESIDLDIEKLNNEELNKNDDLYSLNIFQPIESYSFETWFMYKCLTYFSELNTTWKNDLRKLRDFGIILNFDIYFNKFMTIKIALHSPNDLPIIAFGSSTELNRNFMWLLRYNTIKTERLGHQYDTNCKDYKQNSEYKARQDCIKKCYVDKINNICNGTVLIQFGFLMQNCPNITKYTPCPIQFKINMAIYSKCQSSCRLNCWERYYSFLVEKLSPSNETYIFISKNMAMPDITIKHIPDISFISFICNFGGLLGMWLGLSFIKVLTTIKDFLIIISKFRNNKTNVTIYDRNFFVNQMSMNVMNRRKYHY